MLHIFRKDVRRLWWEIAVTLVLLTTVAGQYCWRENFRRGYVELLLNFLLPTCWRYLAVLLIYEETPSGDRQF